MKAIKFECSEKDHAYNPVTLDGKCVECGGKDPNPQHTPTPLYVESVSDTGIPYLEKIVNGKTIEVATFDIPLDGRRNAEIIKECKAERAYICRAVNSHSELLMNLRFLVDAVKNGSHADMEIAIRKSDKAIAKAEGK